MIENVALLGLSCAVNPVLLGVVLLTLASPHPKRMLGAYFAGAFTWSVGLGIGIVTVAADVDALGGHSSPSRPIFDLVIATALLLGAYWCGSGRAATRTRLRAAVGGRVRRRAKARAGTEGAGEARGAAQRAGGRGDGSGARCGAGGAAAGMRAGEQGGVRGTVHGLGIGAGVGEGVGGGAGGAAQGEKKKPLAERLLSGSAPLAFLAGVAFNFPSIRYIDAIKEIVVADVSRHEQILAILLFNVLMLSPAIVPLGALVVHPTGTRSAITRIDAWMRAHARLLLTAVLAVLGLYMLVKGILALS